MTQEGLNNGNSSIQMEGEMMQRLQKTVKSGCLCQGMVEPESNREAHSILALENEKKNDVTALLEKMLNRDNLNRAFKRVKRNRGAAGIDGMTVEQMLPYLKEHKNGLVEALKIGRYRPNPVKRVEIPKPDGGKRMLGIPTVIDRMLQQALTQVLQPIFEPIFSDNSFGYRPKRCAQQAIKRAKEYFEEGYAMVVDIDLAKYFDTVNHDLLIRMVREHVKDERIIDLIRKFLKSGVMANGIVSSTVEGTPQGGNLSPLLSNVYLTGFDRLLESRNHKFVRYADDCNIYVKSHRAAERVMTNCVKYLENKLKLKVNRKKSRICSPSDSKFLGFSLYKTRDETGIIPHRKALEGLRSNVRRITSRKRGRAIKQVLNELKVYTTGWIGYYAISDMKGTISGINGWIRRRIRQYLWKQWKKVSARFRNLKRLGINKNRAWKWANTRLAYWRIAGSQVLSMSLTNKYLMSIGYDDISIRYEVLHRSY